MKLRFFGRTDLWISLSRAKFDEEADFEVRSAVDPPRQRQIGEKRNFLCENFSGIFLGVKQRNIQNRPKRVLAKFRTNPSHVRRVAQNFPLASDSFGPRKFIFGEKLTRCVSTFLIYFY